ncbi:MAG: DUF1611 domain-containing protein [Pseudomonadota bacterium]
MKTNHLEMLTRPIALKPERLAMAKFAYTTRRVERSAIKTLLTGERQPHSGDLLLARVEKLGHHQRIELEHGRRAPLFSGDEVVVCYGNRYAPDQFESEVPADLSACHLVAAGGIASICLSRHSGTGTPTRIQPLGLLGDANGMPINIADWGIDPPEAKHSQPLVLAVVGTAMNAGKTTTAAHLIKGLSRAGMKVGGAKLTGTGAGGDRWLMSDSGAIDVVDFTDAGFASTYRASLAQLECIQSRLMSHLRNQGVEAIVMEIADGLFQRETAMLLESPPFKSSVNAVIFAAGDAMGACSGAEWLRQRGLPLLALSGCLSASPLASREAEAVTGLPVLGLDALSSPDIAVQLFERHGELTAPTSKVG